MSAQLQKKNLTFEFYIKGDGSGAKRYIRTVKIEAYQHGLLGCTSSHTQGDGETRWGNRHTERLCNVL